MQDIGIMVLLSWSLPERQGIAFHFNVASLLTALHFYEKITEII